MDSALAVLAGIVVVGVAMQWLAWRLRIPSIFLLLLAGFVLGQGTGWLDPDLLFGEALFPIISLSVAVILFEGGLSLDIAELRKIGRVVRRLITWGTLITWVSVTWAAQSFLGMDFELALLLGAVLIVTGPTVIIPMLRQIRPKTQVASPIRWEGIVNDPIGAILAVLVFDIFFLGGGELSWGVVGQLVGKVLLAGGGFGLLGAWVLVVLLEKFWVPDFLQSPVTLGLVMLVFTAADLVLPEAGLLAVTVMGSALASQRRVPVERITQFKENLRVLLISGLFVILAARLPLTDPVYTDPRSILFVGFLIVVVRPAGVFLSTIGTNLTFKERVFLSWMAPRGIVAAAVASVFALELHEIGYPDGDRLASIVFMVIIATVALYGLTAGPLARWLGVAATKREGVFIVGAAPWVRSLAKVLVGKGIPVSLVDANWNNVRAAKQNGLEAHYANVLSDTFEEEHDFDNAGQLLALTPNDEVNALAAYHLREIFDRANVYQLPSDGASRGRLASTLPRHLQGRILFSPDATWKAIAQRFEGGWVIKSTRLTAEFGYEEFRKMYGDEALPLLAIESSGHAVIFTAGNDGSPTSGQTLISLVKEVPAELE